MRLRGMITDRTKSFESRVALAGLAAVVVFGGLAVRGLIRGDAGTVQEGLQLLAGAALAMGAILGARWWRNRRT